MKIKWLSGTENHVREKFNILSVISYSCMTKPGIFPVTGVNVTLGDN